MKSYVWQIDRRLKRHLSATGIGQYTHFFSVNQLLEQDRVTMSGSIAGEGICSPLFAGVLVSADDVHRRGAILDRLAKLCPDFDPSSVRFVNGAEIDLKDWVQSQSLKFVAKIFDHAAKSERENAELRMLFEKAQLALHEFERHGQDKPAARLVFQSLPGKASGKIHLGPQSLEVSTRQGMSALHAFDIHLSQVSSQSDSTTLEVNMHILDSGRLLARWLVGENKLRKGWNRFYCPVTQEPYGHRIVLTFRSSGANSRTALTAAQEGLISGVDFSPKQMKPFALRLWSGVVGLKLPKADLGYIAEGASFEAISRKADLSELLELGTAADPEWTGFIGWSPRDRGLMVHPMGTTPAVASLGSFEAADLLTLKIGCKLANPSAVPTLFCAWVTHDDEVADGSAPPGNLQERSAGFLKRTIGKSIAALQPSDGKSVVPNDLDWLHLRAGEEGELQINFKEPHSGSIKLMLATRNLDGNNSNAWAVFTDLRLEYARS